MGVCGLERVDCPKMYRNIVCSTSKGRKAFSFSYDPNWISSQEQLLLDPDIAWYGGQQYPNGKENFGVFLDSMPDTWGRTLMKRRAISEISPILKVKSWSNLLGTHKRISF